MKKTISLLVAAVMVFSCIGFAAADDMGFTVENGTLTAYSGSASVLHIPSSVYRIADSVFEGKTFITEVHFPDTLVSIGRRAFKDCTGLTRVVIPTYVVSVSTDTFSGCTRLSSVTLSSNQSSIGAGAFRDCPISSISFPYSMKSIGIHAFTGSALTSVTLPSTIVGIGDFAFGNGGSPTVHGVAGSRAQSFAETFNHPFAAITEPNPLPIPAPLPTPHVPGEDIRGNAGQALYMGPGERPAEYAVTPVNYLIVNTAIDDAFYSTFKNGVTREECAYFLVNVYFILMNKPIDLTSPAEAFADTDSKYATKARELEITMGTDAENNLFSPSEIVTREQMTCYFVRMLNICSIPYNTASTDYITFTDRADISSWAVSDVFRAYHLGLINGMGGGVLAPKNSVTREQVFTMIYNLMRNLPKIKQYYTRGSDINTPQLVYSGVGKHATGYVDEAYYSTPSVVDLNGDGRLEIISTAYSIFNIDAATGNINWQIPSGFDRNTPATTKPKGRAFADVITMDIDGDGSLEIVTGHSINNDGGVVISNNYWRGVAAVYDSNGYFKPGWPIELPRPVNSIVAHDLNGDGRCEIVVGLAGETSQSVWVFDASGNILPGWPQLTAATDATQNFDFAQNTGYQYGIFGNNIAVGDINGDGVPEIVVPSDLPFLCAYDMYGNLIKANAAFGGRSWGRVGTWEDYEYEKLVENEGWGVGVDWQTGQPIDLFTLPREKRNNATFTIAQAVIYDVDKNGVNEVVVIGTINDRALPWPELPLYQAPFILNGDRSRFKTAQYDWTSIPKDTGRVMSVDWLEIEPCFLSPTVCDLDMDGVTDIVYPAASGKVLRFSLDRANEWSYWACDSTTMEYASPVAAVDINNDGMTELVFTTTAAKNSGKTGSLVILDSSGRQLHKVTLPAALDGSIPNGGLARPIVRDIDSDGRMEIIINSHLSGVVMYRV